MSEKHSHSRARARTRKPAPATEANSEQPTETIDIAVGPNVTGHADQVAAVHVPHEPADAATGIGEED